MYNYHTCRYFRRTLNRVALSVVGVFAGCLIFMLATSPADHFKDSAVAYARQPTASAHKLSKRDVVKLYEQYRKRVAH